MFSVSCFSDNDNFMALKVPCFWSWGFYLTCLMVAGSAVTMLTERSCFLFRWDQHRAGWWGSTPWCKGSGAAVDCFHLQFVTLLRTQGETLIEAELTSWVGKTHEGERFGGSLWNSSRVASQHLIFCSFLLCCWYSRRSRKIQIEEILVIKQGKKSRF